MENFDFKKYTENKTNCISPCPDQYFANLENGSLIEKNREDIIYNKDKKATLVNGTILNNIIAIVLESPHTNEFDNNGLPIGPAMGVTGKRFIREKKGFIDFISSSSVKYILKGNYKLVYVNSIQYQTSLGKKLSEINNKITRDDIWISIFEEHGGKVDLKKRLNALNPVLIINLCTKGLKNLQLYVNNEIKTLSKYTFGTHPSTWNFSYAYIK